MKLKTLLLLFAVTTINLAYGQDFDYQRDFKNILKETTRKNSKLNYDILLKRFTKGDTTLTPYEVLALQIGFTANKAYRPYRNIKTEGTYIRSVRYHESDTCIFYGSIYEQRQPVGLAINYALYKAYEAKNSNDKAALYKRRYFMLVNSILFSGDGNGKPYFVLSPIDGQILITEYWNGKVANGMGSGEDKYGNFLDMLTMEKDGKSTPMSFNIQHAFEKVFDK